MDYESYISCSIQNQIACGRKKFILYPFGEHGKLTKSILNKKFNIQETLIIDNQTSSNKIYSIEYLKDYNITDEFVIVTSDRADIYSEIREQLKKYISEKHIIDLFEKQDNSAYYYHLAEIYGLDKKSNICTLKTYNVKFYLPFWKTDYIQRKILFNSRYYEDLNLFYITKLFRGGINLMNKVVLDIGANIGNHSIYFAKECLAGKVISFEPIEQTFKILQKNIKLNELQDIIIPYNFGIGEEQSYASASDYDLTNIGGITLQNTSNGNIKIFSIDELNLNENISLIKIDVEGFEEKVIKGSLKTIKKYMPMIMIEAWEKSNTICPIIKMLCKLGYDFKRIDIDNYIFFTE